MYQPYISFFMVKFFSIVGFLFLGISKIIATGNYPAGARALGLSNAVVSFSDTWSTFHNQAGLAFLNHISAGFYSESRFQVKELSLVAGSVVIPAGTGNFGFSFSQFGSGNFRKNRMGLAFAKSFSEKFGAGIQMEYLSSLLPENQRARGFVTFEGGLIFSPAEKLHFGAHVFNPVRAGMKTVSGEIKAPVVFRAGGHYAFDESVLLTFEGEKETRTPFVVRSGIEFLPVQNLVLRMGVSGKPFHYTAGIGYTIGKVTTDIGFSYHGNLGLTPAVSLQFFW